MSSSHNAGAASAFGGMFGFASKMLRGLSATGMCHTDLHNFDAIHERAQAVINACRDPETNENYLNARTYQLELPVGKSCNLSADCEVAIIGPIPRPHKITCDTAADDWHFPLPDHPLCNEDRCGVNFARGVNWQFLNFVGPIRVHLSCPAGQGLSEFNNVNEAEIFCGNNMGRTIHCAPLPSRVLSAGQEDAQADVLV